MRFYYKEGITKKAQSKNNDEKRIINNYRKL